jgi:hypothetical protein
MVVQEILDGHLRAEELQQPESSPFHYSTLQRSIWSMDYENLQGTSLVLGEIIHWVAGLDL